MQPCTPHAASSSNSVAKMKTEQDQSQGVDLPNLPTHKRKPFTSMKEYTAAELVEMGNGFRQKAS